MWISESGIQVNLRMQGKPDESSCLKLS